LLDATVDCLVERGYASLSTTEIADRAGVSRGAQLHHYPTKGELVSAAIEHLFQRRHEEYLEGLARLPPGTDRAEASIEKLWSMFSGPTFYAWLELLVAARTDPSLRRRISGVAERFAATVETAFREQFPEAVDNPFFPVVPGFTFALLQGLSLEHILESQRARVGRTLDAFRQLSLMILPQAHAPSREPGGAREREGERKRRSR
jgi:AcrR family transcriptional regulator